MGPRKPQAKRPRVSDGDLHRAGRSLNAVRLSAFLLKRLPWTYMLHKATKQ